MRDIGRRLRRLEERFEKVENAEVLAELSPLEAWRLSRFPPLSPEDLAAFRGMSVSQIINFDRRRPNLEKRLASQ